MNKEQQIKELTKLIQAKEIHPCDDDVHCEDCYCACKGMAEMIYNAGYRKVNRLTNFEKIKNMGIEDFTSFLCSLVDCGNCTLKKCDGLCYKAWLHWLVSDEEDK